MPAAVTADDVDNGIELRVRTTAVPGNISVAWNVGTTALNAGANDFELQYYVGGGQQWQPQFSTDESTDHGNPAILSGTADLFCFRMVATIDGSGTVLGSGTSGNAPPCADPPPDADSDGVPDAEDDFPNDPTEWADTDGDGTGNTADTDDDGDGLLDQNEINAGTDPLDADTDGDGDQDGVDNCPLIANSGQEDSNRNGVGDACETDLQAGDVLQTGWFSGAPPYRVYRYRNGAYTVLASGSWDPRGVATDGTGEVYVGGLFGQGVYRLNPGSNSGEQVFVGLPVVIELGLDGQLYVVEAPSSNLRSVSRIDPNTRVVTPLFNFEWSGFGFDVTGVTADAAGNVYVSGEGIRLAGGASVRVLKWSSAGGVSVLHGGGCQNGNVCVATGIAFTSAGSLLVSDWTDDQVVELDVNTGSVLASISVDRATVLGGGAGDTAYVATDSVNGNDSMSDVDFQAGRHGPHLFGPLSFITGLAVVEATPVDTDGDGAPDNRDAFPADPNEWQDTDDDGTGDNADLDDDNDGLSDLDEVTVYGTDPMDADSDEDGVNDGDEIAAGTDPLDSDEDDDGIINGEDNCPLTANADQTNFDGDGLGDVCDSDDDNDGVNDTFDEFPFNANESADNDGDGTGDNADADDDNDGMPDAFEIAHGLNPFDSADAALDPDQDGFTSLHEFTGGSDPTDERSIPQPRPITMYVEGRISSVAAEVTGGPYVLDGTLRTAYVIDSNPVTNPDMNAAVDRGHYLLMDYADLEVNGAVQVDLRPRTPPLALVIYGSNGAVIAGMDASAETTGGGVGAWTPFLFNVLLRDSSNTTFPNGELPQTIPPLGDFSAANLTLYFRNGGNQAQVWADLTVHQEISTVAGDFDGDGASNATDNCPITPNSPQTDTDGDGAGNPCDDDDDNDAAADEEDDFPLDASEQTDTDGDGIGDNSDAFPNDPSETTDTDGDGTGNNADMDDDNDGLSDADETGVYGTNPLRADTDRDGLNDGQEIELGLNPLDPGDCPEQYCPRSNAILRIISILSEGGA